MIDDDDAWEKIRRVHNHLKCCLNKLTRHLSASKNMAYNFKCAIWSLLFWLFEIIPNLARKNGLLLGNGSALPRCLRWKSVLDRKPKYVTYYANIEVQFISLMLLIKGL